MAGKRLHDLERETLEQQTRMLATIDRQRSELSRFLSPQVAALVSSAGRRGDAGRPSARDHVDVLRPAQLHVVLRGRRAGGGPRVPAGLPRRDGSAHRRARGHARALRRRRLHDVLQRPDPAAGPRRPSGGAWRSRCATTSRDLSADWRKRGYVLEIGVGIATGYATLGRIGFEGRYDYGAVGHGIILAARLSGEAAAGEILISIAHVRRRRSRRSTRSRPAIASSRGSAGRSRSTRWPALRTTEVA